MGNFKTFWSKNGATILTGVSVVCGIAAPIWAAIQTPKAIAAAEEARSIKGEELTNVEKVKATWKTYIGPAAVAAVGIGCGIGANGISATTIKQLGETYNALAEQAAAFESTVQEKVSAQKFDDIKSTADAKTAQLPANSTALGVKDTGYGETLFIDKFSGQVFRSSVERIRQIELDLNDRLRTNGEVFLAEYYAMMGLKQIDHNLAWSTGWEMALDGTGKCFQIKLIHTHAEQLEDGTPVGIVSFGADSLPRSFR